MNSEELYHLLQMILAMGNYMNGGTTRGQADGFHIEILCKLHNVKSRVGCVSF